VRIDLAESGHVLEPRPGGRRAGARLLIIAEDAGLLVREQLAVAVAARQAGYDVHIAAATASDDAEAVLGTVGLALHRAPISASRTPPLEKLRSLGALDRLVRTLSPDLLHCIGLKPVLYGGTIARLRHLPAVLAVPGLGSDYDAGGAFLRLRLLGFALGAARATIVVKTPEDRLSLVRARVLDPQRRTFLLRGAAADLARFASARPPRPAGAPPLVLVSPEGLDESAQVVLWRALQLIRDRGIAARFVLAPQPSGGVAPGLCTAQGALESDAGLRSAPEALARADLFCQPGNPGEGIPQGLIEAAAAGRAMVAPDLRGCREVVRPGVTGWLFPPGDAAGLSLVLERVLLDAPFRKAAGERARELAVAEFSQDTFLTAALAVYRAGLLAVPFEKRAPLEKMT
jgi:glycosyltransferase involved in cell wall biosynthesis